MIVKQRYALGLAGKLDRLTRDHSLVVEMVRSGQITSAQAQHHAWRDVVTNAIGCDDGEIEVEVHRYQLMKSGDRLLLCSDSLTGMVPDNELCECLADESDPETACRQLVDPANQAR